MSDYQLGQRVTMSGTALKQKSGDKTFYVDAGKPFRSNYPNNKTFDHGVIVGSRTVIDGYRDHDGESGYYFCPIAGTSRRAWIVAFDLRMKPVMCFDHQITPTYQDTENQA